MWGNVIAYEKMKAKAFSYVDHENTMITVDVFHEKAWWKLKLLLDLSLMEKRRMRLVVELQSTEAIYNSKDLSESLCPEMVKLVGSLEQGKKYWNFVSVNDVITSKCFL